MEGGMTLRRSDDFDVVFSGVGGLPYGLQSGVLSKTVLYSLTRICLDKNIHLEAYSDSP
jgi:hypothetical protein